jgi:hypothetical protein
MSPQAIAKARAVDAAPSNAVFGDGRGVISAACKFCQDEGGYGCACHGCGRVGTRVRL